MAGKTTIDPLIATKLHRPPLDRIHIHRPHLLERLDQGRSRSLTLVSAPAGYGKSVLIRSWLESCDIPSAWISLDKNDNDLRTFTTYFMAAVKTLFSGACRNTQALLSTSDLPPIAILTANLINELDRIEQPFIMALDDFHLMEDESVLDMKTSLDEAGVVHQDQALRQAAEQAFYNTSSFTMRDLKARASQQQLRADFEAYLDGFSPNVQDILENFEFRNQLPRLSKADALGTLIDKLTSPDINLSPNPVKNSDGSVRHPGLDNHAMGTIFEELVRRFNEENNEEAGEHWTPRDAVKLMAKLIFLPVADAIESGTYLLYDGACGTGGMLTVAENTLQELAKEHDKKVAIYESRC